MSEENLLALVSKTEFRRIVLSEFQELKKLLQEGKMAIADINTLIQQLNDKTNELAANDQQVADGIAEVGRDLQALKDQLAQGASPEQVSDVEQKLGLLANKLTQHATTAKTNADALTVLGQDQQNPIP